MGRETTEEDGEMKPGYKRGEGEQWGCGGEEGGRVEEGNVRTRCRKIGWRRMKE